MRVRDVVALTAVLMLTGAATARAQATTASTKPATSSAEPELRFDREYFLYPVDHRRDPFESLAGREDVGPRFEELKLAGIIYSAGGRSVALLKDDTGRIHRLRRGDSVGNARVIDIGPRRVIFAVDMFGVVRQEQLELKRTDKEGVDE